MYKWLLFSFSFSFSFPFSFPIVRLSVPLSHTLLFCLFGLLAIAKPCEVSGQISTGFVGSNTGPAIIYFNNAYRIFYRDSDGNLMQIQSTDGGNTWTSLGQVYLTAIDSQGNSQQSPVAVSAGPGVTNSINGNNFFHLFGRDPNGNGIFHIIGYTTGEFVAANPYWIEQSMDNSPAAAVAASGPYQGRLCVVGSTSRSSGFQSIVFSTLDYENRIVNSSDTAVGQYLPPTIVWWDQTQKFYVFYEVNSDPALQVMLITSADGVFWSGQQTPLCSDYSSCGRSPEIRSMGYSATVVSNYLSTSILHLHTIANSGQDNNWEFFSTDGMNFEPQFYPVLGTIDPHVQMTAATYSGSQFTVLAASVANVITVWQSTAQPLQFLG